MQERVCIAETRWVLGTRTAIHPNHWETRNPEVRSPPRGSPLSLWSSLVPAGRLPRQATLLLVGKARLPSPRSLRLGNRKRWQYKQQTGCLVCWLKRISEAKWQPSPYTQRKRRRKSFQATGTQLSREKSFRQPFSISEWQFIESRLPIQYWRCFSNIQ